MPMLVSCLCVVQICFGSIFFDRRHPKPTAPFKHPIFLPDFTEADFNKCDRFKNIYRGAKTLEDFEKDDLNTNNVFLNSFFPLVDATFRKSLNVKPHQCINLHQMNRSNSHEKIKTERTGKVHTAVGPSYNSRASSLRSTPASSPYVHHVNTLFRLRHKTPSKSTAILQKNIMAWKEAHFPLPLKNNLIIGTLKQVSKPKEFIIQCSPPNSFRQPLHPVVKSYKSPEVSKELSIEVSHDFMVQEPKVMITDIIRTKQNLMLRHRYIKSSEGLHPHSKMRNLLEAPKTNLDLNEAARTRPKLLTAGKKYMLSERWPINEKEDPYSILNI